MTSDPHKQYDASFSLWNAFPYSPPCLLSALCLCLSIASILIYLPETKAKSGFEQLEVEMEDREAITISSITSNDELREASACKHNGIEMNEDNETNEKENELNAKQKKFNEKEDEVNEKESETNERDNGSLLQEDEVPPLIPLYESDRSSLDILPDKKETFIQKHQAVMVVIASYMIQACTFVAWDEIYPLWSKFFRCTPTVF